MEDPKQQQNSLLRSARSSWLTGCFPSTRECLPHHAPGRELSPGTDPSTGQIPSAVCACFPVAKPCLAHSQACPHHSCGLSATGPTKVNEVGSQDAAQAGRRGADSHAHVSDHSRVQLGRVHVDHGKGCCDSKLAHHHQDRSQIIQVWRGKGKKGGEGTSSRYTATESSVCGYRYFLPFFGGERRTFHNFLLWDKGQQPTKLISERRWGPPAV